MVSSGVEVLGTTYSTYVNRVQIALNLKFVDYDYIEENLMSSKSDLLLKSNLVNKKVPVLIHDDKCICESRIIVQYIDETWTSNGYSILPFDSYDRAVPRLWAAYFDDKWIPLWKEVSITEGEAKDAAVARAVEGLFLLDEAFIKISNGKAYFGGESIGYLDIVIGIMVNWIKAREIKANVKLFDKTKTPTLVKWAENFTSNDHVKDVLPSTDKAVEILTRISSRISSSDILLKISLIRSCYISVSIFILHLSSIPEFGSERNQLLCYCAALVAAASLPCLLCCGT
ncbi:Glutathione transferase [Heracleum sosnowskyi]|uniref:glutathione transferase n=1 Tax=Heracleum sosnowskyi TaxID=360622 RepID=A0AAD8MBB2_9APIA|nr:Glutathione transferase [Heracleum sosnowskyi]